MADRLCISCKRVVSSLREYLEAGAFERSIKGRNLSPGQYTISRLSAADGCGLCQLVFQLLDEDPKKEPFKIEYLYPITIFKTYVCLQISDEAGSKYRLLEYYRSRDKPLRTDDDVQGRDRFPDPKQSLAHLAIPWIKECRETHAKCAQPALRPLPTRILVVGAPGDLIYLRDSVGLHGDYMILSHSWGTKPTLRTTQSSLAERQKGTALENLPATFADAVRVTRLLGIEYLWIDSLCIIQEDAADWMAESIRMLDYYRNAYATISALYAKDSFAGFLHDRAPNGVEICSASNLSLREYSTTTPSNEIFLKSVLESRAWCLQERLISTRILSFETSELFWECQTHSRREASTKIESDFSRLYPLDKQPQYLKRALMAYDGSEDLMGGWYHITVQYSKRNLTRETDMLPAISAVADFIQHKTGNTYFHGLWMEDLFRGLMWLKPEGQCRRTGVPSWSWAATTGTMVYVEYNFDIKLLSKVEYVSSERAIGTGELRVRSRCHDIVLRRLDPNEIPSEHTVERYLRIQSQQAEQSTKPLWTHGAMIVEDEAAPANRKKLGLVDLDHDIEVGEETLYKAMEVVDNRQNVAIYHTHLYFLVLAPCGERKGAWKRVGLGVSLAQAGRFHSEPRPTFDQCEYEELSLV